MVDASEEKTQLQNPLVMVLGGTSVALLIATIVLAIQKENLSSSPTAMYSSPSNVPDNTFYDIETIFQQGENTCEGANPKFENVDCVHVPGPQAGANVTKGYVGGLEGRYPHSERVLCCCVVSRLLVLTSVALRSFFSQSMLFPT